MFSTAWQQHGHASNSCHAGPKRASRVRVVRRLATDGHAQRLAQAGSVAAQPSSRDGRDVLGHAGRDVLLPQQPPRRHNLLHNLAWSQVSHQPHAACSVWNRHREAGVRRQHAAVRKLLGRSLAETQLGAAQPAHGQAHLCSRTGSPCRIPLQGKDSEQALGFSRQHSHAQTSSCALQPKHSCQLPGRLMAGAAGAHAASHAPAPSPSRPPAPALAQGK